MKFAVTLTIDVPEATDLQRPKGVEGLIEHYMGAAGCFVTGVHATPLDLKVAAVLNAGEAYLQDGQDLPEVIANCGDALDDANTGEILGTAVFLGTDGRVHILNVEAEVGQIADDYLTQVVKDYYDADQESAVYVMASEPGVQGQWPDHGYGYEYVKGGGWSVVLLGGINHEQQVAVVVPTSSVFHEDELADAQTIEWDHPDKAEWSR